MTNQTNHLKLPFLSFLGIPLPVVSLPNRGMKKQNKPNVGQASLLDFKYENTKRTQTGNNNHENAKRTQTKWKL
jgi:hypothetical protein